jgi:hypothetical protein
MTNSTVLCRYAESKAQMQADNSTIRNATKATQPHPFAIPADGTYDEPQIP